ASARGGSSCSRMTARSVPADACTTTFASWALGAITSVRNRFISRPRMARTRAAMDVAIRCGEHPTPSSYLVRDPRNPVDVTQACGTLAVLQLCHHRFEATVSDMPIASYFFSPASGGLRQCFEADGGEPISAATTGTTRENTQERNRARLVTPTT